MSRESLRLLDALTHLSDQAIDLPQPKRRRWRRWGALAACLCLAAFTAQLLSSLGGQSGGGGSTQAATFQSYAGPLLPLTLREENNSVTAQRDITLDFAPWIPQWVSIQEMADEQPDLSQEAHSALLDDYARRYPEGGQYRSSTHILVTDTYRLTNASPQPQTLTLLYPFVSSLASVSQQLPSLTLEGQALETTLLAGGSSEAPATEENGDDPPQSWEAYRDLLSNGAYQAQALAPAPDLSAVPATLYRITADIQQAPGGLTVTATFDPLQTNLLSYGFSSGSCDWAAGVVAQGFSPEQTGEAPHTRYLIAVGSDLETLSLSAGEGEDVQPQAPAGADVQAEETTLAGALEQVAPVMYQDWLQTWGPGAVSYGLYHDLLCRQLQENLFPDPAVRNDTSSLEDLNLDGVSRVFYVQSTITLPPGASLTLQAVLPKAASFDYRPRGGETCYGYDLVTRLGSNLSCTQQTATLEARDQIEIVRQNFGFDLQGGITTVRLDPETPHYYLEVRPLGN